MKNILSVLVVTGLLLMPVSGFSATSVTKVGKVLISAANVGGWTLRFERSDSGTFDGCTLHPRYVYNFNRLDNTQLVAMLLSAKQNDLDVMVH